MLIKATLYFLWFALFVAPTGGSGLPLPRQISLILETMGMQTTTTLPTLMTFAPISMFDVNPI